MVDASQEREAPRVRSAVNPLGITCHQDDTEVIRLCGGVMKALVSLACPDHRGVEAAILLGVLARCAASGTLGVGTERGGGLYGDRHG